MDWYLFWKALHIIGFVTWFAGLFYLVRLFVYHREAWERPEPEGGILRKQYALMEGRLYRIIQTPAMIITLTGGIAMLVLRPFWLQMPWMHVKLGLLLLLIAYHFSCAWYIRALRQMKNSLSSFGFRLYNELPTLVLIAVVMLAVWKSLAGLWLGLVILVALGLLFFLAARCYRQLREHKK